jgi:citrate lyase beta subunit
VLTLWTNAPDLAARADAAGIDRVGLDLETIGKHERQAGLGTWISSHSEQDLPALAAVLSRARLFARTEPSNPELGDQVERLIEAGVQVLMLPMFSSAEEVARFADHVAGRATVVLLLETAEAMRRIDEIVAVAGVDEIHLGLNDLALSIGATNRFEVLTDEGVAHVARTIVQAGLRFGAGGLGRVDDRSLPIPTDLIYAQYARLGATAALVSRAFLAPDPARVDLDAEVTRARERLAGWALRPAEELEAARTALKECASRSASW